MRYLNLRIPIPDPQELFHLRSWLPSRGNVLFTLLVVAGLLWASNAGALPLRIPSAASTSTGTIAYQGRLADSAGTPITDTVNMEFRLYDVAEGGTPLWSELWTGSNAVRVSDGLFNVMLGSLEPIPQEVVAGHDQLWLGITVGTDDEMTPRVQLGSVPFAVQALTVPDGSVTTEMVRDGAITSAKLDNSLSVVGNFSAASLTVENANVDAETVTLNGTSWVELNITYQRGVHLILVHPKNGGGPTAAFVAASASWGIPGSTSRLISESAYSGTAELELRYRDGTRPEIRKTASDSDGDYRVVALWVR